MLHASSWQLLAAFPSLGTPGAFALLVIGFGLVIFVHELGHFLVAKAVRIRVTQFAIGFGPAIFSWRKGIGIMQGSTEPRWRKLVLERLARDGVKPVGSDALIPTAPQPAVASAAAAQGAANAGPAANPATGAATAAAGAGNSTAEYSQVQMDQAADALGLGETEYRLNYLPLGGYVKMLGQEDLDPTAQSSDPRSFNRKPIWARACVVSAGVAMNLTTGAAFIIIAFMMGLQYPPPRVGQVVPHSPAAMAYAQGHENDPAYRGLKPDDEFIAIDGEKPLDFMDLNVASALGRPDAPISVTVLRQGERLPLTYSIVPKGEDGQLQKIGVAPQFTLKIRNDGDALPDDLTALGLKPGMVGKMVAGRPASRLDEWSDAVIAARGVEVPAVFTDPATGQSLTVSLAAQPSPLDEQDLPGAGILGMPVVASVGTVNPRSPAEKAGMKSGDVIARVDGVDWPAFARISDILLKAGDRLVPVTVERDAKLVELTPVRVDSQHHLGITLRVGPARIAAHDPDDQTMPQDLADLHLPAGSQITAVNGLPVTNLADLQRLVQAAVAAAGTPATAPAEGAAGPPALRAVASAAGPATQPAGIVIHIAYTRALPGSPSGQADIRIDSAFAPKVADAAWVPVNMQNWAGIFELKKIPLQDHNPVVALSIGLHKTKQFVLQTYVTILRLFQHTVPVHELRGPVGIAQIGTATAREGLPDLLYFLGIISVNLVVINFLPIPIVDGGLMVFLIIEKLKGSPVPPKVLEVANVVGLTLIGGLFLMTLYFDVLR